MTYWDKDTIVKEIPFIEQRSDFFFLLLSFLFCFFPFFFFFFGLIVKLFSLRGFSTKSQIKAASGWEKKACNVAHCGALCRNVAQRGAKWRISAMAQWRIGETNCFHPKESRNSGAVICTQKDKFILFFLWPNWFLWLRSTSNRLVI